MPFADPEKRRAYQRAYQRRYAKKRKRAPRDRSKRPDRLHGLERFDACVAAGRCIWHCLTSRPCRNQAVAGLYCEKHRRG